MSLAHSLHATENDTSSVGAAMRSITLLRRAEAKSWRRAADQERVAFSQQKSTPAGMALWTPCCLATGFQKLNLRSMQHLLRGVPQTILSIYCCISSPVCVLHIERHALDPFLFNAFISIPQPFQIYPPLKCLTSGL